MAPARVRTLMPMTMCSGMWAREEVGEELGGELVPSQTPGGSIVGEGVG